MKLKLELKRLEVKSFVTEVAQPGSLNGGTSTYNLETDETYCETACYLNCKFSLPVTCCGSN